MTSVENDFCNISLNKLLLKISDSNFIVYFSIPQKLMYYNSII